MTVRKRKQKNNGDYDRSAALNQVKSEAIELLAHAAAMTVFKAANVAILDVFNNTQHTLLAVAHAFSKQDAAVRQNLFQQLGESAQRAMLASYASKVTGREGPASQTHYRAGAGRFAGGVLRAALADPAFFNATPLGIEFGNQALLDESAAQWHRLNFGAGARAGSSSPFFPVAFGGGNTEIGLEGGPSGAFSMPEGVWINSEGGRVGASPGRRGLDAFSPQRTVIRDKSGTKVGTINTRPKGIKGRSTGMRPTQGIRGKHFIDAGVRVMAEDLPKVMKEYRAQQYAGLSKFARRRSSNSVVAFRSPASLLEIEIP